MSRASQDGFAVIENAMPPTVIGTALGMHVVIAAIMLIAISWTSDHPAICLGFSHASIHPPIPGGPMHSPFAAYSSTSSGCQLEGPWHQDLSIAVKERHEVAGFGPWSVKEGVPVQPPVEILESMLTLRLHLDDCHAGMTGRFASFRIAFTLAL